MNKLIIFMAGLFCANFAVGAAQPCNRDQAGKTACVAGELMLCNKEFDTTMHAFRYEWHGVNNVGQPFDIYFDSEYKKVPGLTPATCTSNSLTGKLGK